MFLSLTFFQVFPVFLFYFIRLLLFLSTLPFFVSFCFNLRFRLSSFFCPQFSYLFIFRYFFLCSFFICFDLLISLFFFADTFCLPSSRSLLSKLLSFHYSFFIVPVHLLFCRSSSLCFFLYRSLLLPCDVIFVLTVYHY
jgi:hypothetical protein